MAVPSRSRQSTAKIITTLYAKKSSNGWVYGFSDILLVMVMITNKFISRLLRYSKTTIISLVLLLSVITPVSAAQRYDCGAYGAGTYNSDQTCSVQSTNNPDQTSPEPLTPQSYDSQLQGGGFTLSAKRVLYKFYSALPVPPTVIPLLPLIILLILAVLYLRLAWLQNKAFRLTALLLKKSKATRESTDMFLDIISHYLNTPLSIMQNGLELTSFLKEVTEQTMSALKQSIADLKSTVNEIITQYQNLASQYKPTEQAIVQQNNKLSKGFIIPTIISLSLVVVFVILNAQIYPVDFALKKVIFWGLTSLASLGFVLFAYFTHLRLKKANEKLRIDKSYEDKLIEQRIAFIEDIQAVLSGKINSIRQYSSNLPDTEHIKPFRNGLAMLQTLTASIEKATLFVANKPSQDNDISLLINKIIEQWQAPATNKQVSIVPNVQPNVVVSANADDITQIVDSMLNNAVKFSPSGGKVTIKLQQKGKNAVLTIIDNGPGLLKEQIEMLTQPFFRGTDTKQFNYEGLGLSLYIDKIILDRMGGRMAFDSNPGSQTTIEVTIPIHQPEESPAPASVVPIQTATPQV